MQGRDSRAVITVEGTLTNVVVPTSEGTRTVVETPTNEETGRGLYLEDQSISLGCHDTMVIVGIETSQEVGQRTERGLQISLHSPDALGVSVVTAR